MDSISSHKSGEHDQQQPPSSETNKMDMGRMAGAGSDLLGAASHYGKLEGTGVGQYAEKAETYLHEYGSSHPSTTTNAAAAPTSTTSHSGGDQGHSESGSGEESGSKDYFKMAEGFLKKH
ncbi:hypothetical protein U1Q18_016783 [Sarracenia purpurea var. burkii]